jgi:hypothetical protein
MKLIPYLSPAAAVSGYKRGLLFLDLDRAFGTQHGPAPKRNIPLIMAYRGILAKAKRKN